MRGGVTDPAWCFQQASTFHHIATAQPCQSNQNQHKLMQGNLLREWAITAQCRPALWQSWIRWPSPMTQLINGRLHHEQVLLGQRTKKLSGKLGGHPFYTMCKKWDHYYKSFSSLDFQGYKSNASLTDDLVPQIKLKTGQHAACTKQSILLAWVQRKPQSSCKMNYYPGCYSVLTMHNT